MFFYSRSPMSKKSCFSSAWLRSHPTDRPSDGVVRSMGGDWPEDACALVIILNRSSILTPTFAAIVEAIRVHVPHRFVCRQPREPHPGERNFAPRNFGQKSRLFAPGDRQISSGDWTSSRQPAEFSGFFKPAVVLPARGDWLVELRGFELDVFRLPRLSWDHLIFLPRSGACG
jgi:hypothetical protein